MTVKLNNKSSGHNLMKLIFVFQYRNKLRLTFKTHRLSLYILYSFVLTLRKTAIG